MQTNKLKVVAWTVFCCIGANSLSAQTLPVNAPPFSVGTFGTGYLYPIEWSGGCGVDCVYLSLNLLGILTDYPSLIRITKVDPDHTEISLNDMQQAVRDKGAFAIGLDFKDRSDKVLVDLLKPGKRVIVAHLLKEGDQPEHFVCIYLARTGELRVVGGGTYQRAVEENWQKRWSGKAIIISSSPMEDLGVKPRAMIAPRLRIDRSYVDLGEVPFGGLATVLSNLQNAGNSKLHIKSVIASCGCTKVAIPDYYIEPGNNEDLTASVSFGEKLGYGTVQLSIFSDDPERGEIDLRLGWTVRKPFMTFEPATLKFTNMEMGQEAVATVKLNSPDSVQLSSGGIEKDSWVKTELEGNILKVMVQPDWPTGQKDGLIVLHLLKPEEVRRTIPISVSVAPELAANPPQLFYGKDNSANAGQLLRIMTRGNSVQALKKMTYSFEGIEGTAEEVGGTGIDQASKVFRIRIKPSATKDRFTKAAFKIHLANGKQLEVPLLIEG